eukprot:gene43466-53984_t
MDAKLIEGVQMYRPVDYRPGGHAISFFDKVADHVGMGVTVTQCKGRFSKVNPEFKDRKKGDWIEEEIARLKVLAEEETQNPTGSKNGINWI